MVFRGSFVPFPFWDAWGGYDEAAAPTDPVLFSDSNVDFGRVYRIDPHSRAFLWSRDMNVGDVIDEKYRLVRLIGEGGMGAVYEAVHTRIRGKQVAIKVLRQTLAENQEVIARFEREAEAAAAIGHEGIIDIYDLGREYDGSPYLIMEFLEGHSLSEALGTEKKTGRCDPLGVDFAVFVACSVLSALSAAHEAGIIHRDLKPDNIFLVDTGAERPKVKILDFGIARITEPGDDRRQNTLTRTGAILGTPYFMSPEQALGHKDLVDQRTDLWAMGVILYRCLTGYYPFEGQNYNQVMAQIISDREPKVPSVLNPNVPQALEEVISRAIRKDQGQRYSAAKEMLDDLRPLLSQGDLGLLDYHARQSSKRPVYNGATAPDGESVLTPTLPVTNPSAHVSQTPMTAVVQNSTKRRRSPLFALVLGVVTVVALGLGGAVAALLLDFSRDADSSPGGTTPFPNRPSTVVPGLDVVAPSPATPTSTAQPQPLENPLPGIPTATAVKRSSVSTRNTETPVIAKRPPNSEPDAGAPHLDAVDADVPTPEPPAVPVRAKADRGSVERPRAQPDDPPRARRTEPERPPNRYPARPPPRPNYGQELPRSRTPEYGREL